MNNTQDNKGNEMKYKIGQTVKIDGRNFKITDAQSFSENFYRLGGNENYVSENFINEKAA